jgi:hypothetical protein
MNSSDTSVLAGTADCQHLPPCPPAWAPDRVAARTVCARPEQGWSLLCNSVVVFDDGGDMVLEARIRQLCT